MPKLICFDMDGVIFEHKNFWMELHKELGTQEEGKRLTEQYLHSDYGTLVEKVVNQLWKGKNAAPYFQLVQRIRYLPGVKAVFREIKRRDDLTAIISSGPLDLARRAQHDFGIDFVSAHELIIKDNIITGEFLWPLGGKEKKAQRVQQLCTETGISPRDTIFVGDSDIDLGAFQVVGTSIAFNSPSPELRKHATYVVDNNDLRKILPFL